MMENKEIRGHHGITVLSLISVHETLKLEIKEGEILILNFSLLWIFSLDFFRAVLYTDRVRNIVDETQRSFFNSYLINIWTN